MMRVFWLAMARPLRSLGRYRRRHGVIVSDTDAVRFYRGHSMRGAFRPGDCLTVAPVPLDDVRPGDVVVYRGPNHQGVVGDLVHRVVAVTPDGLIVQGDNNPSPDATLATADNLVGKVTHVERSSKTRRVRGGQLGLLHARMLRIRRRVWIRTWGLIARVGRGPYRWLRESGLVPRFWRPVITKICLVTENGPLVKYICGRQTVARWWPAVGRFQCCKPYDLVIPRPSRI